MKSEKSIEKSKPQRLMMYKEMQQIKKRVDTSIKQAKGKQEAKDAIVSKTKKKMMKT